MRKETTLDTLLLTTSDDTYTHRIIYERNITNYLNITSFEAHGFSADSLNRGYAMKNIISIMRKNVPLDSQNRILNPCDSNRGI